MQLQPLSALRVLTFRFVQRGAADKVSYSAVSMLPPVKVRSAVLTCPFLDHRDRLVSVSRRRCCRCCCWQLTLTEREPDCGGADNHAAAQRIRLRFKDTHAPLRDFHLVPSANRKDCERTCSRKKTSKLSLQTEITFELKRENMQHVRENKRYV